MILTNSALAVTNVTNIGCSYSYSCRVGEGSLMTGRKGGAFVGAPLIGDIVSRTRHTKVGKSKINCI